MTAALNYLVAAEILLGRDRQSGAQSIPLALDGLRLAREQVLRACDLVRRTGGAGEGYDA